MRLSKLSNLRFNTYYVTLVSYLIICTVIILLIIIGVLLPLCMCCYIAADYIKLDAPTRDNK